LQAIDQKLEHHYVIIVIITPDL